jgi:hypothetical protein
MGLSVASLFGYRNGSIKISTKGWGKLEQAERLAGIWMASGNAQSSVKPNQSGISESPQQSLGGMIRAANDEVGMRQFLETLAARVDKQEELQVRMARMEEVLAQMALALGNALALAPAGTGNEAPEKKSGLAAGNDPQR